MRVFFFTLPPKTWIRPLFLDFFENRRNYAISMVHNVFQGHLEVAEHVFDIILHKGAWVRIHILGQIFKVVLIAQKRHFKCLETRNTFSESSRYL